MFVYTPSPDLFSSVKPTEKKIKINKNTSGTHQKQTFYKTAELFFLKMAASGVLLTPGQKEPIRRKGRGLELLL